MTLTTTAPTARPSTVLPWVLLAAAAAGTSAIASATVAIGGSFAAGLLEWLLVVALIGFGVPLAVWDFWKQKLPNLVVWPLYGVIGALVAFCGVLSANLGRVGIAVLAGLLMWGIYFGLGLLGAAAYGDVKLAGALGLALGWWGFLPALAAAAAAFVLAFPHAVTIMIVDRGKKDRRKVPFGPYMLAGAIIVGLVTLTR